MSILEPADSWGRWTATSNLLITQASSLWGTPRPQQGPTLNELFMSKWLRGNGGDPYDNGVANAGPGPPDRATPKLKAAVSQG